MSNDNITVVYRPINSLNPAEYNPRKHTKEQAAQLKDSLSRFGLVDPVICNSAPERENVIIGGHFRLEIAKELGMTEVPVVYINIPDIEKERELNLRLNKNTGEFDFEKLKAFDFDLLLDIGFDQKELDDIWNKKLNKKEFDPEAELKKAKEPTIQPGTLIELGAHRLICADSTKPETYARLFGDERASMIMSDPPYNIDLDYDKGIGGKQSYGGKTDDSKSDTEYTQFLRLTMEGALSVANKNAHVFYWSDETYIWLIQTLYRELGIKNKRVCLWLKNGQNPTPGVAFNKCYEPCTYGVRGRPIKNKGVDSLNEVMNVEMTTGNELFEQVQDHFTVWPVKRLPGKEYEHTTMKPPEVYEKAIRRCTKMNDIILDSFSGSGSTIMAAEKLKRRVFAVEIEPVFCDLAIKRYEALTGVKAKIIQYGQETPKRK
jgi:DNA modification methylase